MIEWLDHKPDLSRRRSLTFLLALATARQALGANDGMVVKVGFLRQYKPFSYRNASGRLRGFDVDVTARVCEVLQLQMVPVVDSLEGLVRQINSGAIAWLGNQVLMTTENRQMLDFVRPAYASIQLSAIQHEDDERDFLSLEDLVGKRLGVQAHTGMEEQARGVLGKSVKAYEHIEDALHDLSHKKLDMVLEENLIADHYIKSLEMPIKVAAPFASPLPVGLGVRKGDQETMEKLSKAVQRILQDGSFQRISERWFGYDVSRSRVSHSPGP